VQVVSYADGVFFRWVRNFLVAFLIMLCVKVIFFILGEITDMSYWDTWWYFLVFAMLFYYIAITGYANSIETKIAFQPNLLQYRPALLLNYNPSSINDNIATEEAEIIEIDSTPIEESTPSEETNSWKEKILHLMQAGKAYEDPELSLTQVAKQLQSNPSHISKMVNKGFGVNFNDFVNQYRIEGVKEMLNNGEHKKQTLLGIAFECGFNSKATFNRAFKKVTGLSPKEWIQQNG
jgi:AraC-like DNA-binding protein